MAGAEQGDEVANRSAQLNKGGIVEIWCHYGFRGSDVKAIKSCKEVEEARHHDEGYCDGSALPRHDPMKGKQNDFGIVISKARGHVLSPEFDRIRGGPRLVMGLKNIHGRNT